MVINFNQKSQKYISAKNTLPKNLQSIFEQLIDEYIFYTNIFIFNFLQISSLLIYGQPAFTYILNLEEQCLNSFMLRTCT